MNTPLQKGDALETAVRAIENVILRTVPALAENTFLIHGKKILIVDDVRHEIDLWVEVDLGKGYNTLFIFECKNWESKVDKNEIIIFSKKIEVSRAQKGFFVAKSFTKDTLAQAKHDPRITILLATEHSPEEIPVPFDMHFVVNGKTHADFEVIERGKGIQLDKVRLDAAEATTTLGTDRIDLDNYVRQWISEACDERLRSFPSGNQPDGVYELETSVERHFDEGEFVVNGKDMRLAKLHVAFQVHITRPPVVSYFEVPTRGRALTLAPVRIGDAGEVSVTFVGTDHP